MRTRSYAQAATMPCFQCSQTFEIEVWLIVDAVERPDLVEAIHADTVHTVRCPHCGTEHPLDAPLLFHDGTLETLIFAAQAQTEPEQNNEVAQQLGQQLIGTLPLEERAPYLTKARMVVGIDGLRQALEGTEDSDDVSVALRALMEASTPQEVAAAVRDHQLLAVPDVQVQLREYVVQLRDAGHPDVADALDQRLAALPPAPLHPTLRLIQALLDADGPEARQSVLTAHPVDVTPEVAPILEALAQQSERSGLHPVARDLLVMRDEVLHMIDHQG
ncbi:MAG: hypothetical protein H0X37_17965 [Herpetosiphonaceae bacterium]|nr:hypothetical protein [Herpetosiphonaceae bacterium]